MHREDDSDAIDDLAGDGFFTRALGVGIVLSSLTLRRRMDCHASAWCGLADEHNPALLSAWYAGAPTDFAVLLFGCPSPARIPLE